MKIDSSRYSLFWTNPERYRLREIWKLSPIEPPADSWLAQYTQGRRRGTVLHEILDARHRQVGIDEATQSLRDGGFGDAEIKTARRMHDAIVERYPNEEYLSHEVLFEYQIPESPHVLTGRIDHLLKWKGNLPVNLIDREEPLVIGDWKSSKKRTKKDLEFLKEKYKGSAQVPFYIRGAQSLGMPTFDFLYRIVEDRGKDAKPLIHETWTERSTLELRTFDRSVHQTCELICWMKATFGIENSWPNLWEAFPGIPGHDYSSMLGRKVYPDFMPDGFEPKKEHLSLEDSYEPEDVVDAL